MITMSHGYPENPNYVFHDGYNLVELPRGENPACSDRDDAGPYVLATLRNVFSDRQCEEYEYIVEGGESTFGDVPGYQDYFEDMDESQDSHEHQDHEEEEDEEEENDDTKKEYPCSECSKVYTSERRLKHHKITHKNKEAFKCPTCGFCYQSPDSLRRHMKKTTACNPELQHTVLPQI